LDPESAEYTERLRSYHFYGFEIETRLSVLSRSVGCNNPRSNGRKG
jgi:hypothetical protein